MVRFRFEAAGGMFLSQRWAAGIPACRCEGEDGCKGVQALLVPSGSTHVEQDKIPIPSMPRLVVPSLSEYLSWSRVLGWVWWMGSL